MYASALVAFIVTILLQVVEINPAVELERKEGGSGGEPIVTPAPVAPEFVVDLNGRSPAPKQEELQAPKVDKIKEESSLPSKEKKEVVYSPLLSDESSGAVIHDMMVRSLIKSSYQYRRCVSYYLNVRDISHLSSITESSRVGVFAKHGLWRGVFRRRCGHENVAGFRHVTHRGLGAGTRAEIRLPQRFPTWNSFEGRAPIQDPGNNRRSMDRRMEILHAIDRSEEAWTSRQ
jgi:hypothetical protein